MAPIGNADTHGSGQAAASLCIALTIGTWSPIRGRPREIRSSRAREAAQCPIAKALSWTAHRVHPIAALSPYVDELRLLAEVTGQQLTKVEVCGARLESAYWRRELVNGAIPIADMGCASSVILVVTGPEAGTLWEDRRADEAGIQPLTDAFGAHVGFSRSYLDWIRAYLKVWR